MEKLEFGKIMRYAGNMIDIYFKDRELFREVKNIALDELIIDNPPTELDGESFIELNFFNLIYYVVSNFTVAEQIKSKSDIYKKAIKRIKA